jgi:hypothetical protein
LSHFSKSSVRYRVIERYLAYFLELELAIMEIFTGYPT